MTPTKHMTVLAGLAAGAAIDEKKALVRLRRNTLNISQAAEEILVQGLALARGLSEEILSLSL